MKNVERAGVALGAFASVLLTPTLLLPREPSPVARIS